MDFSMFMVPYVLAYTEGRRTAAEVIDWDLKLASWADEYGLTGAFFAEHYTIGHEPSPSPELMIAAASQRTSRIKLGAAAHLLPYHNPANLAHRLMWLDHMTGGRYIAGFAPGSFPTDAQLFSTAKENPKMMIEALDIIEAIWMKEPPFRIEGQYWTVDMPAFTTQWAGPHLKPLQRPRPEVVLTGMQAQSPTFTEAGKRGYSPMSQQVSVDVLRQQWDHYAATARDNGYTPDRANWRVIRDVFVADTDEEARRLVLDGAMGETWERHILPTFKSVRARGFQRPYALGSLLVDPGMEVEDLTIEWMVDNFWLVGSPDTVAGKVAKLNDELGGVGEIVTVTFDYSADPEPYRHSIELLGTEVIPRVADVGARATAAA
ncbi:LLM class flavin-dependent oxidoreductase [Conexibacter stalactiti]|uniref:LLM class flavin-dependent oxidoreductase n=1 Tax=Conexibacter stalactiti TaxID=1940611 RepID=A0ABU4HM06_9ACTN|nr:LLM class flavin-dependent oxidoreductase [Conexibacter stalactiti]MDW5593074.1 LLM class flavin-dependent oxidoreductase [Conexibacter stalactiti]MEC5033715.1 LLM class flavin-dependent oxidoreductase [Conexibacter stalactiti]